MILPRVSWATPVEAASWCGCVGGSCFACGWAMWPNSSCTTVGYSRSLASVPSPKSRCAYCRQYRARKRRRYRSREWHMHLDRACVTAWAAWADICKGAVLLSSHPTRLLLLPRQHNRKRQRNVMSQSRAYLRNVCVVHHSAWCQGIQQQQYILWV